MVVAQMDTKHLKCFLMTRCYRTPPKLTCGRQRYLCGRCGHAAESLSQTMKRFNVSPNSRSTLLREEHRILLTSRLSSQQRFVTDVLMIRRSVQLRRRCSRCSIIWKRLLIGLWNHPWRGRLHEMMVMSGLSWQQSAFTHERLSSIGWIFRTYLWPAWIALLISSGEYFVTTSAPASWRIFISQQQVQRFCYPLESISAFCHFCTICLSEPVSSLAFTLRSLGNTMVRLL
mmetsp:Transcript_11346/g.34129  ORF Transcript_11346/g.34129 Transcript_11346/m.34129 type:complete len:230 (-) Transcript_11346:3435-4124(-)